MTISDAFNAIAQAQGGTPDTSGTIAGAIDALNDALAGSDQPKASSIADAVSLLGEHIASGGGGGDDSNVVDITFVDPQTGAMDKTYSQVETVIGAGTILFFLFAGSYPNNPQYGIIKSVIPAVDDQDHYTVRADVGGYAISFICYQPDDYPVISMN